MSLLLIFGCIVSILLIYFGCAWFYIHCEHITCTSDVCLVGKTALVTGGSKGIGYDIVLQLASRGCKVIIASRTVDEKLRKQIIRETNNPNIILEYVDMASFKSVRLLASRLILSESKLDILINNVGMVQSMNTRTEDGLNETMQVNHFSSFLLTHLLVELLRKSEGARVVFTTSFMAYCHTMTRRSVRSLKFNKNNILKLFDYSNSKFCNTITSDIFAKKLKQWNITCNSYQPGLIKTEIFTNAERNTSYLVDRLVYYPTLYILKQICTEARVTSQGAVQIAIANEFKNVTGNFVGRYFHNIRPRLAYDTKFCEAIWQASEEIVQLKPEEKLD
ncbi:retinol dehydrogenase 12-like [Diabrotica undecimpunctata]|uniref:retinol dehydrogenase 12-like n=1 Tax=Diabrotica undecimpunctata TaxID=50387 RepID=UPI003B63AD7B